MDRVTRGDPVEGYARAMRIWRVLERRRQRVWGLLQTSARPVDVDLGFDLDRPSLRLTGRLMVHKLSSMATGFSSSTKT